MQNPPREFARPTFNFLFRGFVVPLGHGLLLVPQAVHQLDRSGEPLVQIGLDRPGSSLRLRLGLIGDLRDDLAKPLRQAVQCLFEVRHALNMALLAGNRIIGLETGYAEAP